MKYSVSSNSGTGLNGTMLSYSRGTQKSPTRVHVYFKPHQIKHEA